MPWPVPGPVETYRLSRGWVAALVVFGVTMLGINLGATRVLTAHEVFMAEGAREMLATGDWLVPKIGGVIYTTKPPLTHWLVAVSMSVFGPSEAAVRLPSMLSGVAAGLLVAMLAARWHGRRIGVIAGFIQLTAFDTLMQSRLAEPDMILGLCVLAAMSAFALSQIDSPRGRLEPRWLRFAFLACVGLAFLTKGPVGIGFIGVGCGLFVVTQRRWDAVRILGSPAGWMVASVCIVGWPLAAYWQHPEILDGWYAHNVGRFAGEMQSEGPLLYAGALPLMLLPWTPLVVAGAWLGRRDGHWKGPLWRFLGLWALGGLAIVQASAFKHKHYLIPALPPLSIFAAWGLHRWVAVKWKTWRPVAVVGILSVGGVSGGLVALAMARPELLSVVAPTVLLIGLGGFGSFWLGARGWKTAQLAAGFGTVWLAAVLVQSTVIGHFDSYRDQTVLARRINRRIPAESTLFLVDLPKDQITYYLRMPLRRIDEPARFIELLGTQPAQVAWVVGPQSLAERLDTFADIKCVDRCDSLRKHMTEADRLALLRVRLRRDGRSDLAK